MKLTLIRHTSTDVQEGVCYGFSDVSLKDSFETEAFQVKERLNGKPFDLIYSSPLSRCTLLADYCGYTDAVKDDRIKELNFGDWEMKSWMQIDKKEISGWLADWINYPAKNGESYIQMKIRIDGFLDELKQSGKETACIFTHGGVIRLMHVYAGIYSLEESFESPVEYGQTFEIEIYL